jgi:uncharacterized membrane protein YsdA (DUF1294 family)
MPIWMIVLLAYLLAVNIVGMYVAWSDKRKARLKKWRTPEKAFWIIALLGGGAGVLCGFYAFRHKTKHGGLVFTVALCAAVSYAGCFFLWRLLNR